MSSLSFLEKTTLAVIFCLGPASPVNRSPWFQQSVWVVHVKFRQHLSAPDALWLEEKPLTYRKTLINQVNLLYSVSFWSLRKDIQKFLQVSADSAVMILASGCREGGCRAVFVTCWQHCICHISMLPESGALLHSIILVWSWASGLRLSAVCLHKRVVCYGPFLFLMLVVGDLSSVLSQDVTVCFSF